MSVKIQVLKLLEESRDTYLSGTSLAKKLSVSRASVWKAMQSLRKEGYGITGVSNKGYRLEQSGDTLCAEGIHRHIKTEGVFLVETKNLVTSTNTLLREEAARGAPEGYVLAAEAQASGKGRLGRGFHSPMGHGVYFSLILRPKIRVAHATLITAAAAVSAARAIEAIFDVNVGIKWVNDLHVKGKKICGILTEATIDMESGMVDNSVLGIGINVTQPAEGYPPELQDSAASIVNRTSGRDSERCRLIAATLDNFWQYYKNLPKRAFLDEYRKRSVILGREVIIMSHDNNPLRRAIAIAINDECGLEVRYTNGKTETLKSGEVSIV